MNHKDAKALLFARNPKVKEKYDELDLEYKVKHDLIRARLEKGLSQKDLAELVGTKQSAISRFERPDSNPTIGQVQKIANVTGVQTCALPISMVLLR
jgi:ribosome-binding protein aMBF1 (putative translation factor)